MDYISPSLDLNADQGPIIVKADEVDESGADISAILPESTISESDFNERIESRRAQDAQTPGSPKILANSIPSPPRPLSRPILKRQGGAPLPPQQPPPPIPLKQQGEDAAALPADSLSLAQLKALVSDIPKVEPRAYAYEYEETRSFPEEIQEWFSYSEDERQMLQWARDTFHADWTAFFAEDRRDTVKWHEARAQDRETFVRNTIAEGLSSSEVFVRGKALQCATHIALGVWDETAGLPCKKLDQTDVPASTLRWIEQQKAVAASSHLRWIQTGVDLLTGHGLPQIILTMLDKIWTEQSKESCLNTEEQEVDSLDVTQYLEANFSSTLLYVLLEACRWNRLDNTGQKLREEFLIVRPKPAILFAQSTAKLRWEDTDTSLAGLSRRKLFLLSWKSLLVTFGCREDLDHCKMVLKQASTEPNKSQNEDLVTTTPIDYHLFRQEIISKYPTYDPPLPLLPLEPNSTSILAPIMTQSSRGEAQVEMHEVTDDAISIFNRPVHIATPAPSPPPSPAVLGKAGKKQNYQTNQDFPFLIPLVQDDNAIQYAGSLPVDNTSQQRKFGGAVVPKSILEAGELFASRMRMSRSMKQTWAAREKYVREERGWDCAELTQDYDRLQCGDKQTYDDNLGCPSNVKVQNIELEKESADAEVQRCLDEVYDFYQHVLPDLQSIVTVIRKQLFVYVHSMSLNGSAGPVNGEDGAPEGVRRKTNPNSSASLNILAAESARCLDPEDSAGMDVIRCTEITIKALSGIILTMLKWFKLSHVLEYEYMLQLLLDANVLTLILKYFAHQDTDRAVEQKHEFEDFNLFSYCQQHSAHPPPAVKSSTSIDSSQSSEDEAMPPPILKQRRDANTQSMPSATRSDGSDQTHPNNTDAETAPRAPLTEYSARFFLTNINFLRILQKITKRKAHRALLLVRYKSSSVLRKALKIPQPDLCLYTLKLFKTQVPFCGRKWRQSNMRVITAIYLHCRPQLRDEWLFGGDVDNLVESSLPVEQAGRALVHWWHLRTFKRSMRYEPGATGPDQFSAGAAGPDFITREMEKRGWLSDIGSINDADESVEGDYPGLASEADIQARESALGAGTLG